MDEAVPVVVGARQRAVRPHHHAGDRADLLRGDVDLVDDLHRILLERDGQVAAGEIQRRQRAQRGLQAAPAGSPAARSCRRARAARTRNCAASASATARSASPSRRRAGSGRRRPSEIRQRRSRAAASTLSRRLVKRTNSARHPTKDTAMPRPIRRVVTGHNAQGRSIFIMDGPAPSVHSRGTGATAVDRALGDQRARRRATPATTIRRSTQPQRLPPPKNGTNFRVVEYPPDSPAGRGAAGAGLVARRQVRGLRPRPEERAPSRLPQDRLDRLRHRAVGRNLRADGRGRGAAQGRRRADPARHQSRLEQPHRTSRAASPSC